MVPRPDSERRRVEGNRNQGVDRRMGSTSGDMSGYEQAARAVLPAHHLEEAIFRNPRAAARSARGTSQVPPRRVDVLHQGSQQEWVVWEPWGLSTWSGRTLRPEEGSGSNSDTRSPGSG